MTDESSEHQHQCNRRYSDHDYHTHCNSPLCYNSHSRGRGCGEGCRSWLHMRTFHWLEVHLKQRIYTVTWRDGEEMLTLKLPTWNSIHHTASTHINRVQALIKGLIKAAHECIFFFFQCYKFHWQNTLSYWNAEMQQYCFQTMNRYYNDFH